jgi:hypothetical protein
MITRQVTGAVIAATGAARPAANGTAQPGA